MSDWENKKKPKACLSDALPRVDSFFACVDLRLGSILVGVITSAFVIWHIYFHWHTGYNGSSLESALKGLKFLMIISDLILGIYSIILIFGVVKENYKKVSPWLIAAFQNGIVLLIFELLASPCLYDEKFTQAEEAFRQWPCTIIFSSIPFVELYFMIVVNSYYINMSNRPISRNTCDIPMND